MEYIDRKQAAEQLGVNVPRVGVFIRENRLPAKKIGGVWIIEQTDLDAFKRIPRIIGRPTKKHNLR